MKIGVVSGKGQVVIPKEIRDIVGIHPGDAVMFNVEGGKIIVERLGATGGNLKNILKAGKPLKEDSLSFQRRMRGRRVLCHERDEK